MPNPFTKYTPTTYVPGYVPAPIEQYATTIGALSAQHQQNIATKNSIDVMAANIDVIPTAQWIKDDAIAGINSDLGDILKSGRVQDASYLLPEVYKNRIGANKDLIWAENQSKKVRAAQELNLQYGAAGIDFNPADNFAPVEIDPITKKKIYNEYNVDVEKRTNRLADLAGAFDGAQLKGSTTSLEEMKKLPFYKYIQYKGLQPSEYDKFYALAYEAFKETPSYKQMMKERKHAATSPTGVEMSDADAETDIMGFVHEAGKKYLGSSTTKYVGIPKGTSKGTGTGTETSPLFGSSNSGQRVPIDESMQLSVPAKNKIVVKRNGKVVRKGIRAETISVKSTPGGISFDKNKTVVDKDGNYVSLVPDSYSIGITGRLPLKGEDKIVFDKMTDYQLQEHPELTRQQAMEKAADIWNNGIDIDPQVYYNPFYSKDIINKLNNAGYYYSRENNKSSLGNLGSMNFYSTTTDDNRISGKKLFADGHGNILYDVIRPIGEIPADNPEDNPWRMNRPIIFEATNFAADGSILKTNYLVAEMDINHDNPLSDLKSSLYYGYYRQGVQTEIPSTDPESFTIPIDGEDTRVNARMFSGKKDGKRTMELKFFDDKGNKVGKTFHGEEGYPKNNKTGKVEHVDAAEAVFYRFLHAYYPNALNSLIESSEEQ